MRIKDELGKEHVINLSKYFAVEKENCSALHGRLRQFLKDNFPAVPLLEEVYVPSFNVFLDFYLPLYRLACEADGDQHRQYTSHFHGIHKTNFYTSVGRDRKKEAFCHCNNIRLVRFFPQESDDQWLQKLSS